MGTSHGTRGCQPSTRCGGRRPQQWPRSRAGNQRPQRAGRQGQTEAHLGGDDSVIGVSLRDVGLSTWGGLLVPHVDGPAVHPVLFSGTLWGQSGVSRETAPPGAPSGTLTGGRPGPTQPPRGTFPKDRAEWAVCSPREAGGEAPSSWSSGERTRRGSKQTVRHDPGLPTQESSCQTPGSRSLRRGEDRRAGRHRGRSRSRLLRAREAAAVWPGVVSFKGRAREAHELLTPKIFTLIQPYAVNTEEPGHHSDR